MAAAKRYINDYYTDLSKTLSSYMDLTEYTKLYLGVINKMNADEFDKFMIKLEEGRRFLEVMVPVSTGSIFPEEKVIELIERNGGKAFDQLRVEDDTTGETYITPETYLILMENERRQIQTMESKGSLPESNRVRDALTGAVTGASKGSAISAIQTQSQLARSMNASALELNKGRGGDTTASRVLNKELVETGAVSLASILELNSRPESTDTLGLRWNCIYLDHNL